MDPNQWRNSTYNSYTSSLPRLDIPFLSTEQSSATAGVLSPHGHLAGTTSVPSFTDNLPPFIGGSPFKLGVLSPLGIETHHLREPEPYGLGISPPKPLFSPEKSFGIAEEKPRGFEQFNFSHTSPNFLGSSPTDFSATTALPPPAHCGISGGQSSVQQVPFQSPPGFQFNRRPHITASPISNFTSSVLDKEDLHTYTSNQHILRQDQNYSRDHLLKPTISEPHYNYPSFQPSQVKSDIQYDSISPARSVSESHSDSFRKDSPIKQSFRSPEHFAFPVRNSPENYRCDLGVVTTAHQTNIYNPHTSPLERSLSISSPPSSAPIQAVADSTTKPKRGRGRKKKEVEIPEKTENLEERKLVDSFIQQEQHFRSVSENRNKEPNQQQNHIQNSGNMYGQTYSNTNQNINHFNTQISSNNSSVSSHGHQMMQSQNIGTANYHIKHETPISSNYNGSQNEALMGGQYQNSAGCNDTFRSQGNNLSRNDFLPHGFNGGHIQMSNPQGQERIVGNNPYPYNTSSNQQSYVNQLNHGNEFSSLNNMELESGVYSGEDLYNLDTFNSNNPNMIPQESSTYQGSDCNNATSTIDETAFSSLISDHPNDSSQQEKMFEGYTNTGDCVESKPFTAEPTQPNIAVVNPIEEDDEFQHLKNPPLTDKKSVQQVPGMDKKPPQQASPLEKKVIQQGSIPQVQVKDPPGVPERQKPSQIKSNKNNAFMDSFLSFIQGKKPETLSSVNSLVVKKPELPKYIPEPKRPRQTSVEKSSDSAASTPKCDTDTKSELNSQSNDDTASSKMTLSDEEDSNQVTGTVKSIESGSEEHPSLKMRIKLQKTISPKQKKSKTKSPKPSSQLKRAHSFEDSDGYQVKSSGEEYQVTSSQEEKEMTPSPAPPSRRFSTRKAKEKVLQKKFKDSESEEETEKVPETYDSDSDPAWTPFAEDKKEPSFDEFHVSQRRGRSRNTRSKIRPKSTMKTSKHTPAKSRRVESERVGVPVVPGPEPESSEETEDDESRPSQTFVMGTFVINKKDLNNFEGFPIWKIEAGKMMRKYELLVDKGEIFHRSLSTYSSWLPNMDRNYIQVRTKLVPHTRLMLKDSQHIVQVLEEDRPKPKLDSSKETEYEKDPLAEMFNVYLQVFLSQAMEPTFLDAILESGDDFYIKPLKKIDEIISKKLLEISSKVRWKEAFKKTAEFRPHIREVDRPNLKTLCQVTQNATQSAIKSVHLFGQPYNRTTLQEIPDNSKHQGSVEYLVGKTASHYVGSYHSLHHFKFNLYKRCLAKVDIVREGNTELDNAEILDKCLNNRIWVLKIFDDLKNMLEKG